jgi:hypothetical protein
MTPTLTHYDAFGGRIDQVRTGAGWRSMRVTAKKEGLIHLGYAATSLPSILPSSSISSLASSSHYVNRVHQYAKLYLFAASSAMFSCPLAMTDGAARLLSLTLAAHNASSSSSSSSRLSLAHAAALRNALARLTTTDGAKMWTSGQVGRASALVTLIWVLYTLRTQISQSICTQLRFDSRNHNNNNLRSICISVSTVDDGTRRRQRRWRRHADGGALASGRQLRFARIQVVH